MVFEIRGVAGRRGDGAASRGAGAGCRRRGRRQLVRGGARENGSRGDYAGRRRCGRGVEREPAVSRHGGDGRAREGRGDGRETENDQSQLRDCWNLQSAHRRIGASDHLRNFSILDYEVVVDAIDSVDCKAELILAATEAGVPVVSSMGAALRMDPTKVRVTRFEKVEGDGLARALRQRFKKLRRFPPSKFTCVWSSERPVASTQTIKTSKTQTPAKGSLMQVTATFGMCLASEAIRILTKGENK